MKSRFWKSGWMMMSLAAASTTASAFTVAVSLDGVELGRTSGHEEITRQAMNFAREKLRDIGVDVERVDAELLEDLEPRYFGTKGGIVKNPVILGNFATDVPKKSVYPLSLMDFWKIPMNADWHTHEHTQVIHFLRNYHEGDGTLESPRATCQLARRNIEAVTVDAVRSYLQGRKEDALFLIGHATHTIQDSFSDAHTRRAGGDQNFDLVDICYYPREIEMNWASEEEPACLHYTVDLRDGIWIRSKSAEQRTQRWWPSEEAAVCAQNYFYSENQKRRCMKHEARLARAATARYLFLLGQYVHQRKQGMRDPGFKVLSERLRRQFFEGTVSVKGFDDVMPRGVMRCDRLSRE